VAFQALTTSAGPPATAVPQRLTSIVSVDGISERP
jgi:hypothetical protein